MDISVIVPIYGVEKYIRRSLRSLFAQTKTDDVEFILIDDKSPDRSMALAREVISEFEWLDVKIVEHLENRGVAAARQSGLDLAQGEYIIHFDPDDWCEVNMLEEIYNCARSSEADIVVCDFIKEFASRQECVKQQVNEEDSVENINSMLTAKLHGSLWCKMVRRSMFTENNIYFELGIDMCEDLLVSCKLFSCSQKVVYLSKAYIHYFQNSDSMVGRASIKNKIDMIQFCEQATIYFRARGLYDRVEESLSSFKIETLVLGLRCMEREQQVGLMAKFPELKGRVMKSSKTPFVWKMALTCAYSNRLYIFNIINNMAKQLKRI